MTDEQLQKIRDRHSAATPGNFCVLNVYQDELMSRDQKFIENSWQDIADLLVEAEQAQELRTLLGEAIHLLGDEFFKTTPDPDGRSKRYIFWHKACQWLTNHPRTKPTNETK